MTAHGDTGIHLKTLNAVNRKGPENEKKTDINFVSFITPDGLQECRSEK